MYYITELTTQTHISDEEVSECFQVVLCSFLQLAERFFISAMETKRLCVFCVNISRDPEGNSCSAEELSPIA